MTLAVPYDLSPAEADSLWHMGSRLRFLATGAQTDHQFWLAEQTSALGVASPLHRHTQEDETFVVLSGSLRVTCGDRTTDVEEGGVAFAPRNLPHMFQVTSEDTRFLILGTPAGFEQWFYDTGQLMVGDEIPEPGGPVDFPRILASLTRYRVELLGPPPAIRVD